MSTLTILSIVFVVLILMPFAVAGIYFFRSRGSVMFIRQDMVKDQRFFAHSFRKMIGRALPDAKDGKLKLSREEPFVTEKELKNYGSSTVSEIVICKDGDFESPKHILEYDKEIYLGGDGLFGVPEVTIRAACAEKRMILGNKMQVIRWVDAEDTLAVYDACNLGHSTTAGNALSIGRNVSFQRLFAPVIYLGQYPGHLVDPMAGRDPQKFTLQIMREKRNVHSVTNEDVTETGTAPFSVVTGGNVTVIEGITLQGDIHALGNVRICAGAGVLGNVFSEGNILLEEGSFVIGNVFSQEALEIEPGVLIGKQGSCVSVICRGKMTVRENTVIYGYVSSEEGGVVCPLYSYDADLYEGDYAFIEFRKEWQDVRFSDRQEYEAADPMAFRKNDSIRSAVLPEGVINIKQSMFFACKNMKRLALPASLTVIEDYGLADCTGLEEMTSLADTVLTKIGLSGLENCERLQKLEMPATLESIGANGCAGLRELESLSFAPNSALHTVGEHAFRDCEKLETAEFPKTLANVGISAFRGCSRLTKLIVPRAVEEEPGIAELGEILPNLNVEFTE